MHPRGDPLVPASSMGWISLSISGLNARCRIGARGAPRGNRLDCVATATASMWPKRRDVMPVQNRAHSARRAGRRARTRSRLRQPARTLHRALHPRRSDRLRNRSPPLRLMPTRGPRSPARDLARTPSEPDERRCDRRPVAPGASPTRHPYTTPPRHGIGRPPRRHVHPHGSGNRRPRRRRGELVLYRGAPARDRSDLSRCWICSPSRPWHRGSVTFPPSGGSSG